MRLLSATKEITFIFLLLVPILFTYEIGAEVESKTKNSAQVAIYKDEGTWEKGIIAIENFFDWKGITWKEINSNEVNNLNLSMFYDVIHFPGGYASYYLAKINSNGIKNILEFVNRGGGYLGICAGAYYASDWVYWEGSWYNYPLDLFGGFASGPINEIASWPNYTMTTVNMNLLNPINKYESPKEDMLYYGGPALSPYYTTSVEILATYDSFPHGNAALNFEYGSGRVALIGTHPEIEESSMRDGITFGEELKDNGTDWDFLWTLTDWLLFKNISRPANEKPRISTIDNTSVEEDSFYKVNYTAIDPDDDTITWSLKTNASWLSINSTNGLLTGIPLNKDVGTYWINVSCNDGKGGIDFHNFTLTVINTNDPPIIITKDVTVTDEDLLYYVEYKCFDEDNDIITWDLETNAYWLIINHTSGIVNGTPKNADVGSYWVNISCKDSCGAFDWNNFTLKVINVNDAPIIESIFPLDKPAIYENSSQSFNITVSDEDNNNLTIVWRLDGKILSDATGFDYNYFANYSSAGIHIFNVTVFDGEYSVGHEWQVRVINVNRAPKALIESPVNNSTFIKGEKIIFLCSGTDPDEGMLNESFFVWHSDIDGIIGTRKNLTVSNLSTGTHLISLVVSDSEGLNDAVSVRITVYEKQMMPDKETIDEEEKGSKIFVGALIFIALATLITVLLIWRRSHSR
ncbi:MAG: BPL-N domain-containing protein [Candidatus Thermoplasmatota archaeon]